MPYDEVDAFGDELFGGSNGLIGVAIVVDHDRPDFWPSTPPAWFRS